MKTRKGFSLVELLIVMGIMGILGAMGMISGQEANNIANANKVVEDLRIISAAMNMYYADNKAKCESETQTGETIKTGITPYMKSVASILGTSGTNVGKYLITVHTDNTWWLTYTLPAADTKVGLILANKAAQERFVQSVGQVYDDEDEESPTAYAGGVTVCLQVR